MTALEAKARQLCTMALQCPDKLIPPYSANGEPWPLWQKYTILAKEKLAPRSKHGVRLDQ